MAHVQVCEHIFGMVIKNIFVIFSVVLPFNYIMNIVLTCKETDIFY